MGRGIRFLWLCKFNSSQESPNLRAGSICILRWIQSLGSNVHMWALHRGFVGEIGGMRELGPQLWSSALALPQTPGASALHYFPLAWLSEFVPLKGFSSVSSKTPYAVSVTWRKGRVS